jgi:hypothetical protein
MLILRSGAVNELGLFGDRYLFGSDGRDRLSRDGRSCTERDQRPCPLDISR